MKRTATSSLSGLVLGALLVAGPSIARADAPGPDQAAEAAEQQVEQAKQLGGNGYKSGAVQRAETEATFEACQPGATPASSPVTSPEAQHYARLAEQYRQMGAVGYKTGLVQRAEADAERAQARAEAAAAQPVVPAAAPETYPGACNTDDPWMQSPDCWK